MIIGKHGCDSGAQLVLRGDNLQLADTVSCLGLTYSGPSTKVVGPYCKSQKAAPKASGLKKLGYRAHVSVETMSVLYKTLLRPCLEYASIVWDNCSVSDSRRLGRFQLSVARAVMHQRRRPTLCQSKMLELLGWPTLARRHRRAKLTYSWKLMNNLGPPGLLSRVPKSASQQCGYSLHKAAIVELPACSSAPFLSSCIPSSCILWNSLPLDVSSCSSVASFFQILDSLFLFWSLHFWSQITSLKGKPPD